MIVLSWRKRLGRHTVLKGCRGPKQAQGRHTVNEEMRQGGLSVQCVELIRLLMPKYVTVEEVPDFLLKTLIADRDLGKESGSATVIPSLLLAVPSMCRRGAG